MNDQRQKMAQKKSNGRSNDQQKMTQRKRSGRLNDQSQGLEREFIVVFTYRLSKEIILTMIH